MKKYGLMISLSIMTLLVTAFLWITPHVAFEDIALVNETGDASVLDGLNINGYLYTEKLGREEDEYFMDSVQFKWREGRAEFRYYDTVMGLEDWLGSETEAVLQQFPVWHRPNLDYTQALQTEGALEVWAGVYNRYTDKQTVSQLKVVLLDLETKQFETLSYELAAGTNVYTQLLTYAQTSETELKFLMKDNADLYGEHLMEVVVDLNDLKVTNKTSVAFDNPDQNYLIAPDLTNELVAPARYLFYLSDDFMRSDSHYYDDKKALVLMDPANQETEQVDEFEIEHQDITYRINQSIYQGDDLFVLTYPWNSNLMYQNATEVPQSRILIYAYEAEKLSLVEEFTGPDFNLQLRNGLIYFMQPTDASNLQIQVYSPIQDEMVYQAAWQLADSSIFQVNSLYID
ncbi:hypothetical protein [Fundicoccus ignavus]|uniref:Uncharacterized protein n=1 Tax=Fundicoccus ignavus TaxID=2664442 RepID=A0A844BYM8_9LACT|nr:hypothetical protein [Fundicoccus ignavus]MRJ47158.1 hypothetical protein [Fundicoccus ignavus]